MSGDKTVLVAIDNWINGIKSMPEEAFVNGQEFFSNKEYQYKHPFEFGSGKDRNALAAFFGTHSEFTCKPNQLDDSLVVYKVDKDNMIDIACSMGMFKVGKKLLGFIFLLKTRKRKRRTGLASQLIRDIKEWMQSQNNYDDRVLVVGMSTVLKPHQFFRKRGFTMKLPSYIKGVWKQEDCEMAALIVHEKSAFDDGDSAVDQKRGETQTEEEEEHEQNEEQDDEEMAKFNSSRHKTSEQCRKDAQAQMRDDVKYRKQKEKEEQAVLKKKREEKGEEKKKKSEEKISPVKEVLLENRSIIRCNTPHQGSDVASVHSNVSKLPSGAINKHCLDDLCKGKKISGGHWRSHVKTVHVKLNVKYIDNFAPCTTDNCKYCDEGNNYSGARSSHRCKKCHATKRYDHINKNTGVCHVCEKKKKQPQQSASVVGTTPLNKTQLEQLPQQDLIEQMSIRSDPLVDQKHAFGAMERYNSIESFKGDDRGDDFSMSHFCGAIDDTVYEEPPSKRQMLGTAIKQTNIDTQSMLSTTVITVVVSHTDQQVLETLMQLEQSTQSDTQLALKVQSLCGMFTQDLIFNFFQEYEHTKLASIIQLVQSWSSQLNDKEVLGLALVSFAIGSTCWQGAVKMLNCLGDRLGQIMKPFQYHLNKSIGHTAAVWVCQNWKYIEQQHIQLIQHLNQAHITMNDMVLTLSLAVASSNFDDFVDCATSFICRPVAEVVLECIINRPRQQIVPLDHFLELVCIILSESNRLILEEKKEDLLHTPLAQWKASFEIYRSRSHLEDADSIQQFLDQLSEAYGEIDQEFKGDLTQRDDFLLLALVLHEASNKPNSRQFAMAQYSAGMIASAAHQLLIVPSGQGKSRIAASLGIVSLLSGMFTKVHFVFENEHLKKRDEADFEEMLTLLSFDESKVQHHVGLGFQPTDRELVIIDEADTFMLGDPEGFTMKTQACACVCFTATPDNCDEKGTEAKMIQAIGFKKMNYILDGQAVQPINFDVDEVATCVSDTDKAIFIKTQNECSPVLVFCNPSLTAELKKQGCDITNVTQDIDPSMLRELDELPFKILVVEDKFGGRGIDYRCVNAKLILVIARPFENRREALQGFSRVGRFGDECKRVRFNDVPIVDKKKELMYTAKLIQCIAALQKKGFKKKPFNVKKAIAGSKMPLKRQEQLLAQPATQQLN